MAGTRVAWIWIGQQKKSDDYEIVSWIFCCAFAKGATGGALWNLVTKIFQSFWSDLQPWPVSKVTTPQK